MSWLVWAVMLLLQNASFTWVSRARNSANIGYHAIAAVCSNGIFIASLYVGVDKISQAQASRDWWLTLVTFLFYTTFTVIGSVAMHMLLLSKERGKSRVGAS